MTKHLTDRGRVERVAEARLPTDLGEFRIIGYRAPFAREIVALVAAPDNGTRPVIYFHRQCFVSDVFRATACDCRAALDRSLLEVAARGGAVVYLPSGERLGHRRDEVSPAGGRTGGRAPGSTGGEELGAEAEQIVQDLKPLWRATPLLRRSPAVGRRCEADLTGG